VFDRPQSVIVYSTVMREV